jgi:hypothetical protein
MKIRKYRLRALLLAAVFMFAAATQAYALVDGDTVTYTSKMSHQARTFSVNNGEYAGACIESGVDADTSGTAVATKVGNDTAYARILYYKGIQDGWWENGDAAFSGNTITKHRVLNMLLQYANPNRSHSRTKAGWEESGVSSGTIDRVVEMYDSVLSSIPASAPSSLETYIAAPASGKQGFMFFKNKTAGYVKVKKVSGNTNITG